MKSSASDVWIFDVFKYADEGWCSLCFIDECCVNTIRSCYIHIDWENVSVLQHPSAQWGYNQPGSVEIPVMHVDSPQAPYPSASSGVNIPVKHMDQRPGQPQPRSPSHFSPGYPRGDPTGMPTPGGQDGPLHHQQQPFPRPRSQQPTAWEIPVQHEAPVNYGQSNPSQTNHQSSAVPPSGQPSAPQPAPQKQWSAGPTVTPRQTLAPNDEGEKPVSRGASPAPANMTPLEIVQQINQEADDLQEKVNHFSGTKTSKEYRFLEEMLTRLLLKLDSIESDGKEEIRTIRRQAVKTVQASIDHLELRALGYDGPSDSQDQTQNCTASNNQNDETVDNYGKDRDVKKSGTKAQNKTGVTEMVLDSELHC